MNGDEEIHNGKPEVIIDPDRGECLVLDEEVSYRMEEEQNIINQPPFTSLWEQDFMPDDFFIGETVEETQAAKVNFVRSAVQWKWMSERQSPQIKRTEEYINPKYKRINPSKLGEGDDVLMKARQAAEFLKSFPYFKEYIKTYWWRHEGKSCYDNDGQLQIRKPLPRTYGAYAAENLIAEDSNRWAGLEVDRPGLSTPEVINRNMPSVGKVNKRYKILRAVGLMAD